MKQLSFLLSQILAFTEPEQKKKKTNNEFLNQISISNGIPGVNAVPSTFQAHNEHNSEAIRKLSTHTNWYLNQNFTSKYPNSIHFRKLFQF